MQQFSFLNPVEEEADSETMDNQRLEFFGDAVVEFLTSIHLFFMFPEQEEGSLATFRAALVQNSHLTHLARVSNHSQNSVKRFAALLMIVFFDCLVCLDLGAAQVLLVLTRA